jgi:hypothetical protein
LAGRAIRPSQLKLGEKCGLICFNLQATVPEGFFWPQFLAETSDFLFEVAQQVQT